MLQIKLSFTKSVLKNEEWLPVKQQQILIKDIKFIDKYLKDNHITKDTKVIIWLNDGYANANIQSNILNHPNNKISINKHDMPSTLNIFINIKCSMKTLLNTYLPIN